MEMSGERTINASRADVWAALNDVDVLKACIAGCKEMERTSETSYVARVVQKVGPVKATFTGEIELSDIVEGESYRISGRGKGGAAGAASGGAAVRLADAGEGTLLSYDAEAKVTGKIAQLGQRLINGFAKKMADDFFTRFQEVVEGTSEPEAEADDDEIRSLDDVAETVEEVSKQVAANVAEAIDSAHEAVSDTISKAEPRKKSFWKRLFGG